MKPFYLSYGAHTEDSDELCLMEAVARVAGEKHTDTPKCACPVITYWGILTNDSCDNDIRQRLLGDLPWRIVGTRNRKYETERRQKIDGWLDSHEYKYASKNSCRYLWKITCAYQLEPNKWAGICVTEENYEQAMTDMVDLLKELIEIGQDKPELGTTLKLDDVAEKGLLKDDMNVVSNRV